MVDSLLPPNATEAELAIEQSTARIVSAGAPLRPLWNPETCPADLLPWLAWALSVDDWDSRWPVETKRAVIATSVEVHRRKGTRGSIRRALEAMDYGDAIVIEDWELARLGADGFLIGGDTTLGGTWVLGPSDPHWADYWVEIQTPIRRRDAEALVTRLGSIAPVRCRLRSVALTGAFYTIGDDLWLIGDDIALGNVYTYPS